MTCIIGVFATVRVTVEGLGVNVVVCKDERFVRVVYEAVPHHH